MIKADNQFFHTFFFFFLKTKTMTQCINTLKFNIVQTYLHFNVIYNFQFEISVHNSLIDTINSTVIIYYFDYSIIYYTVNLLLLKKTNCDKQFSFLHFGQSGLYCCYEKYICQSISYIYVCIFLFNTACFYISISRCTHKLC